MEENKCFALYKINFVTSGPQQVPICSPHSCACAVSTPSVHQASAEDPKWALVPSTDDMLRSAGCSSYLVLFPMSPSAGWCEQGRTSVSPELPPPSSQGKGLHTQIVPTSGPCRIKSLWLDPISPSFNPDPAFPEQAPPLPWLTARLVGIQLRSRRVMPLLHISGQPGFWTKIFPAALFFLSLSLPLPFPEDVPGSVFKFYYEREKLLSGMVAWKGLELAF